MDTLALFSCNTCWAVSALFALMLCGPAWDQSGGALSILRMACRRFLPGLPDQRFRGPVRWLLPGTIWKGSCDRTRPDSSDQCSEPLGCPPDVLPGDEKPQLRFQCVQSLELSST